MTRSVPAPAHPRLEFELERSVAVLQRTPQLLRVWLGGLPEEWIRSNEGPDTWSPFDVVGHLIDGERTDWIPRARLILAQTGATFEPFDRFAHLRENVGRSLDELLGTFAELRAENLGILRGWKLTSAQLALEARHPALGRVTMRQLLATWVVHDLNHIHQIARTMAGLYGDAVGAWKEYLGVLK